MWESIKNDPILRAVTVIVLSILGFGFAMNIMFGTGSGNMEHGMGMSGGGYSLENTLSIILALGIKILLIILVLTALTALVRFVLKASNQGSDNRVFEAIKKDPFLKTAAIIILSVITLGLVFILFSGSSGRLGVHGMYGYNTLNSGLVLAFLLKLLMFVFVIGLAIGLFMVIRQNYSGQIIKAVGALKVSGKVSFDCPSCGVKSADSYKYCHSCGGKLKTECNSCGTELKAEWKCCPDCGGEKP